MPRLHYKLDGFYIEVVDNTYINGEHMIIADFIITVQSPLTCEERIYTYKFKPDAYPIAIPKDKIKDATEGIYYELIQKSLTSMKLDIMNL